VNGSSILSGGRVAIIESSTYCVAQKLNCTNLLADAKDPMASGGLLTVQGGTMLSTSYRAWARNFNFSSSDAIPMSSHFVLNAKYIHARAHRSLTQSLSKTVSLTPVRVQPAAMRFVLNASLVTFSSRGVQVINLDRPRPFAYVQLRAFDTNGALMTDISVSPAVIDTCRVTVIVAVGNAVASSFVSPSNSANQVVAIPISGAGVLNITATIDFTNGTLITAPFLVNVKSSLAAATRISTDLQRYTYNDVIRAVVTVVDAQGFAVTPAAAALLTGVNVTVAVSSSNATAFPPRNVTAVFTASGTAIVRIPAVVPSWFAQNSTMTLALRPLPLPGGLASRSAPSNVTVAPVNCTSALQVTGTEWIVPSINATNVSVLVPVSFFDVEAAALGPSQLKYQCGGPIQGYRYDTCHVLCPEVPIDSINASKVIRVNRTSGSVVYPGAAAFYIVFNPTPALVAPLPATVPTQRVVLLQTPLRLVAEMLQPRNVAPLPSRALSTPMCIRVRIVDAKNTTLPTTYRVPRFLVNGALRPPLAPDADGESFVICNVTGRRTSAPNTFAIQISVNGGGVTKPPYNDRVAVANTTVRFTARTGNNLCLSAFVRNVTRLASVNASLPFAARSRITIDVSRDMCFCACRERNLRRQHAHTGEICRTGRCPLCWFHCVKRLANVCGRPYLCCRLTAYQLDPESLLY